MTNTEPRRIGDLLAETLAAIRAAGPVLTKLDVSLDLYMALKDQSMAEPLGYTPAWMPVRPPVTGILVNVDESLPPWARREHYSDGRVVTRYRLVMDPRVRQVAFQDQPYANPPGGPERHGLSLQVRRGRAWVYAVSPFHGGAVTSAWKGARVCTYLPGLKALAERTGLELADWQRDYLGASLRGHHASPIQLNVPRNFGRGLA